MATKEDFNIEDIHV